MTAAVDIKPLTIIKSEKLDGKCSNRFLILIALIFDYCKTRIRHLSSQLWVTFVHTEVMSMWNAL